MKIVLTVDKIKYTLQIEVKKTNDNYPIAISVFRSKEQMPIVGYFEKIGISSEQIRYNAKRHIKHYHANSHKL